MNDRSMLTPPSRSGGMTCAGAKWRLGEGVDGLGDEQRGPMRPPLPGEDPDPVEDDPADEHEEVEEDDEAQDRENGIHGVKCDRRGWWIRRRVLSSG